MNISDNTILYNMNNEEKKRKRCRHEEKRGRHEAEQLKRKKDWARILRKGEVIPIHAEACFDKVNFLLWHFLSDKYSLGEFNSAFPLFVSYSGIG
ncbi:hypothetical protein T11_16378 [Trichinella zimbabwensis]|uniref:Uncharacterized protein n=1 Tax=Trichinella zimbabwensis TaxID=268475 RepID=A0A0V1H5K4_9BILA|nr:hypothetical protein T11_16378 [Trichinella zimbabwensis]